MENELVNELIHNINDGSMTLESAFDWLEKRRNMLMELHELRVPGTSIVLKYLDCALELLPKLAEENEVAADRPIRMENK